jgi:hypothetical protein
LQNLLPAGALIWKDALVLTRVGWSKKLVTRNTTMPISASTIVPTK